MDCHFMISPHGESVEGGGEGDEVHVSIKFGADVALLHVCVCVCVYMCLFVCLCVFVSTHSRLSH